MDSAPPPTSDTTLSPSGSAAPASEGPPKTPGWVWALVGTLVLFALVFVSLHLLGIAPKGH